MPNQAYEGSEAAFCAAYLSGYLRALQRHIGIADTRVTTYFLEELQRMVEQDKAYHALPAPPKSS